jgi:glycosyltransferase involved in cell wall biosynthesis
LKKILFILHFPPPVHGSAVIGGFIKDSYIINKAFKCRYINLGTSVSVEDIGRKSTRKLFRYLYLIWQLKKQLITFRPDLCYLTPTAQGVGFYKDALIIAIVKLYKVKTVFHFHNKGVNLRQNRLFDNMLYRFVFRNTHVILLSKHLYRDIQKYVPENRTYFCSNGIPDRQDTKNEKRNTKNAKLKILNNSVVEILFLSHLQESKGVFVLLAACKILHDKDMDFHCTIIGGEGDISFRKLESEISRLELKCWITCTGEKYGKNKLNAFSDADIFTLPTYNECMPLVIIEAMQNSLPVVSTYEGAIPDLVEDGKTGFLVPQRDSAILAEKLELLIKNNGLRSKMGAAGHKKYEKNFTIGMFESKLKEILDAL